MKRTVEFLPAARTEFDEAADWYESQDSGLRKVFVNAVDDTLSAIISNPLAFPLVYRSMLRRALVRKFPFAIFYFVAETEIMVYAVFHTSRRPIIWRGRID